MLQADLKKSAIENNIKTIQKRIQELEQSFDSVNKELSVEEEPIPQEYNNNMLQREQINQQEKSFSKMSRENNEFRTNFKKVAKSRKDQEEEYSQNNENYETRKMVEGLLREIDILRENEKQADVKIETLTFRCEKLQNELTVKLDSNNRLTMENEDKTNQIKTLLNQIKNLESSIDQNKRNFIPEFQRIKSQYDIALLEIKSLENDNSILENRIHDLTEMNNQTKNEKREVISKNQQIEIERLTLKKEIEEIKTNFLNHENDFEDLNEKYDILRLENDRLKNEIMYLNQKNKIQTIIPDRADDSMNNLDVSRNLKVDIMTGVDRKKYLMKNSEQIYPENKSDLDKKMSKIMDRRDKKEDKNQNIRFVSQEEDHLDFDQLAQIEERFRKLGNKNN